MLIHRFTHLPIALSCLLLIPACGGGTEAAGHANWGYAGEQGPDHWGELDAGFTLCGSGRSQSPIDLVTSAAAPEDLPALECAYAAAALSIVNNGHTIQVDLPAGQTLRVGSEEYGLAQFHFHGPSEHTVDGAHSPMELHLVHANDSGDLAVLGILIQEGAEHAALASAWSHLPQAAYDEREPAGVEIDVSALLPETLDYFQYEGSLTTPPCSEGVSWHVLRTPIELSPAQIEAFRAIVPVNNRPVQPLHGRIVRASS